MAWQNIYIPNITTELSSANLESNSAIELGNTYDIVSVNDLITIGTESVIYEKGTFKITVYATTSPGADYEPYNPTYKVYCNNVLIASQGGFDCDIVGFALGFDYSSKKAKLRAVQRRYSSYPPATSSTRHTVSATSWSDSVQQSIYDALVSVGLITISGGAGSGYIGNSLLSNKKMVGYNVPTSSAEGTKTESVNDVSSSAVSDKPKSGNGFAKIKFLREVVPDEDDWYSFETHIGTWTNGKPVYQIAIPNIDKTLTRNWDVLADVSSLNIDEIIKIDLLGIANSQYYGSLVGLYGAQVCLEQDNIVGYAYNSNIVPYAQTVKLRYTKTTD